MTGIAAEVEHLVERARGHGLNIPDRILFESGSVARIGRLASERTAGRSALLVTSHGKHDRSGRREEAAASLEQAGFNLADFGGVTEEPTVEITDQGAAMARAFQPDVVVAVGGGSVIDCAKAISALARNRGSVEDYLEGVGKGLTLDEDPVPMIAVPTTSGTGAEMTRNAVIADHRRGFKKSMRDTRMIPSVALLDPALTCSCPAPVTAAAGMDAVTQLIEPCISVKRQPGVTDIALRALRHAYTALRRCCTAPEALEAREAMALASAMSGICLANAGLGLVHGIASGLGALHAVPHGLICGVLLPHALQYNRGACEKELGRALAAFLNEGGVDDSTIERGIAALAALNEEIGLPADFKHLGLTEDQARDVAEASVGNSLSCNPRPMQADQVHAFLRPLC